MPKSRPMTTVAVEGNCMLSNLLRNSGSPLQFGLRCAFNRRKDKKIVLEKAWWSRGEPAQKAHPPYRCDPRHQQTKKSRDGRALLALLSVSPDRSRRLGIAQSGSAPWMATVAVLRADLCPPSPKTRPVLAPKKNASGKRWGSGLLRAEALRPVLCRRRPPRRFNKFHPTRGVTCVRGYPPVTFHFGLKSILNLKKKARALMEVRVFGKFRLVS